MLGTIVLSAKYLTRMADRSKTAMRLQFCVFFFPSLYCIDNASPQNMLGIFQIRRKCDPYSESA